MELRPQKLVSPDVIVQSGDRRAYCAIDPQREGAGSTSKPSFSATPSTTHHSYAVVNPSGHFPLAQVGHDAWNHSEPYVHSSMKM
jgi:hypothetical protein